MTVLPEPPTASAAGQADTTLTDAILQAAVRDALHHTSYRDETPLPQHGSTPPVPQPGRPPMSQKATDASALMLTGGAASLMVSGGISLVLWSSGHADPSVVAWMAAAPPMAFLSLKALIKGVKRAAMPEIHNHTHAGPSYHEHHTDARRSIWSKTINKQ